MSPAELKKRIAGLRYRIHDLWDALDDENDLARSSDIAEQMFVASARLSELKRELAAFGRVSR